MHEDIVTRFMTKPYSMPVNHHHHHIVASTSSSTCIFLSKAGDLANYATSVCFSAKITVPLQYVSHYVQWAEQTSCSLVHGKRGHEKQAAPCSTPTASLGQSTARAISKTYVVQIGAETPAEAVSVSLYLAWHRYKQNLSRSLSAL
jgi:hypothetical protein